MVLNLPKTPYHFCFPWGMAAFTKEKCETKFFSFLRNLGRRLKHRIPQLIIEDQSTVMLVNQNWSTKIGCFSSQFFQIQVFQSSIYFQHFNQSTAGGRALTRQLRKLGLNSNADPYDTARQYGSSLSPDNTASRYGSHLASPQQPAAVL